LKGRQGQEAEEEEEKVSPTDDPNDVVPLEREKGEEGRQGSGQTLTHPLPAEEEVKKGENPAEEEDVHLPKSRRMKTPEPGLPHPGEGQQRAVVVLTWLDHPQRLPIPHEEGLREGRLSG